jgi:hypothetical protein
VLGIEHRRRIAHEDFTDGLTIGPRWQYLRAGPYVTDDGVVRTSRAGISVAPVGRNPATGEPMFTHDAPGALNHLKWLVNCTHPIDVDGGPVRITFRAGARCFGVSTHPYGAAVTDPDADYRLGAGTLNVIDPEAGIVLDFWITETVIVCLYERLGSPDAHAGHQAFTQVSDTIARRPGMMHDLAITVDPAAHTVEWEVDGKTVATVARIGPPDPDWTTVLDHGGEPAEVVPRRLTYALGLMTMMDATTVPDSSGLVDQGEKLVVPTDFICAQPSLFGQGVRLDVEHITVERE